MFTSHQLQKSNIKLKTYTGELLPMYGQFTTEVHYHNQELPLWFMVAGKNGPSLLGREWLHSLRLDWNTVLSIKDGSLSTILEKYSGVFSTGLGTLRDLKPNYLWITILGQSSVKLVQSLTVFVHKLKHRSISFYNRTIHLLLIPIVASSVTIVYHLAFHQGYI